MNQIRETLIINNLPTGRLDLGRDQNLGVVFYVEPIHIWNPLMLIESTNRENTEDNEEKNIYLKEMEK